MITFQKIKMMSWAFLLILAVVVVVVFTVKGSGQISVKDAQADLKNGALVIDVRTPGEFNARHLPQAINIPLGEIGTALPQRVTNKNQVLLLHCASGARSAQAKSVLNKLGYTNAFNLGSYERAESILQPAN